MVSSLRIWTMHLTSTFTITKVSDTIEQEGVKLNERAHAKVSCSLGQECQETFRVSSWSRHSMAWRGVLAWCVCGTRTRGERKRKRAEVAPCPGKLVQHGLPWACHSDIVDPWVSSFRSHVSCPSVGGIRDVSMWILPSGNSRCRACSYIKLPFSFSLSLSLSLASICFSLRTHRIRYNESARRTATCTAVRLAC